MKDGDALVEAGMWGGGPHRSQAPSPEAVAAEALKRNAGWFGNLNSESRFALAAIMVRDGLDPDLA